MVNRALYHPDYINRSDSYLLLRTYAGFFFSDGERINWYGNLVRPDGGNGMYANAFLAERWPHKVSETSTIGPG